MTRHRFVYGHTLAYRGLRWRICVRCGQYPQSHVHRVRGWRDTLEGDERVYAGARW